MIPMGLTTKSIDIIGYIPSFNVGVFALKFFQRPNIVSLGPHVTHISSFELHMYKGQYRQVLSDLSCSTMIASFRQSKLTGTHSSCIVESGSYPKIGIIIKIIWNRFPRKERYPQLLKIQQKYNVCIHYAML